MRIDVSVIIPAYNREKTIEKCVYSVINQSCKPYEIIIIDDGSSDRTVEFASQIPYDGISILRQNHKGAQAARNLGIMNAKGNYITFLDSDDEWMPNFLEREIKEIIRTNGNYIIYSDCFVKCGERKTVRKLLGQNGNNYNLLLQHSGPTISILAKREFFLEIGLLDENVVAYQEWDTSIRLAKQHPFIHMREPLFQYNLQEGESISKDPQKAIVGYEYIIRKHRDEMVQNIGINVLMTHYKYLLAKAYSYQVIYFLKCTFSLVISLFYCCIRYRKHIFKKMK